MLSINRSRVDYPVVCRTCVLHCAQLEYKRERDAVDEIMRKIEEEDHLSAAAAAAKRADTQAFIAAFLAQQQHLRCPLLPSEKHCDLHTSTSSHQNQLNQ